MVDQRATTLAYNSPYKFNSKELDEGTGMYYYGARYYDPRISVWMSVDPMAEERSWLSPYNYVQNNPINSFDQFGAIDKSLTDWIERTDVNGNKSIVWDPNVTKDSKLKDNEKYLGKVGVSYDEKSGKINFHNSDGSQSQAVHNLPEVTVTDTKIAFMSGNPSISTNNKSGYIYNDRDLAIRKSVLSSNNPMATYIRAREAVGAFEILNGHDFWLTYGHTLGNLILMREYVRMADLLTSGGPGSIAKPRTFSPQMIVPNTQKISFSEFLRGQVGLDVGKYPGRGNWMKQKALEYKKIN